MSLSSPSVAAVAAPDRGRRAALTALVTAVRQFEGLCEQVGPFALPPDTCDRSPRAVAAACAALGVPLTFDAHPHGERDHAVEALAVEIRRAQRSPGLAGLSEGEVAETARALRDEENAGYRLHTVRRPDATLVTVVDAGPVDAPCILVSPACAMSYRLSLPWVRALSGSYRCLVTQTRGTNGRITDPEVFDRRGFTVNDQAEDLLGVIETLTSGPVHLMGICGGGVPGMTAAAEQPGCVSSLSLWHADLELGPDAAKTDHQENLRALLDAAGGSRAAAASIRGMLTGSPMAGVPDGIGPLVVRPYATDELFYRYANLTAATMHWDSRTNAETLTQPCLVVTSRDDHTAHPDGSRRLAEILQRARLTVTDHGTHLDAFAATPEQVGLLTGFLDSVGPAR